MECSEKYLESLQLLRQEQPQKQNKQVLNRQRSVAENLLQLNFTPANEEHEEYKGERYEVEIVKVESQCIVS